jgi:hypothetical protein
MEVAAVSEEQNAPRLWGGKIDDVMSTQIFGPSGLEPTGDTSMSAVQDPVRSTVAGLQIIERHIVPVTSENLGAVALLQVEAQLLGPDGDFLAELAGFWLDHHHLRGSAAPLVAAMENSSLIRHVQKAGQPVGPRQGRRPLPPGGGGGQ